MIEVRNLTKVFDTRGQVVRAVDDVTTGVAKGEVVVVIASRPLLVSSVMAITETREVSFTRLMNCPANGGSTRLKACGRITWRIDCAAFRPRERAASSWPRAMDCTPARTISAT